MILKMPSFLNASFVKYANVVINSFVGNLLKNLLTQWETVKENQLDQSMKNLSTLMEGGGRKPKDCFD